MIVLSGASLVLPDRILSPGTLVIEDGRIAEIRSDAPSGSHAAFAFHGHYIVPGFIDVHIHGVDGVDTLDDVPEGGAIAAIAARLPAYGVTAFCPTTVACQPGVLRGVLGQVRRARETPRPPAAAHGARRRRRETNDAAHHLRLALRKAEDPRDVFLHVLGADATLSARLKAAFGDAGFGILAGQHLAVVGAG
jgi:alpha-D-ribose 1-methylphosphonate 5-triphosphate diphosphatase PhnM